MGASSTNGNWGKLVMHGYTILHGGDFNENDSFKEGKLVMHGYEHLHGGDLNENEHLKKGHHLIYLFGIEGLT